MTHGTCSRPEDIRLLSHDGGRRALPDSPLLHHHGTQAGSGQQREAVDVPGAYDAEMPAVERGDLGDAVTFGERDDGSVNHSQREVGVLVYQLGDVAPLGVQDGFDGQQTVGDRLTLGAGAILAACGTAVRITLRASRRTAIMSLAMAAKKIPDSVIRAFIKRHRIPSVSTVVEDVGSVRVDPAAAGSPTPPWRRGLRRKHAGGQPS